MASNNLARVARKQGHNKRGGLFDLDVKEEQKLGIKKSQVRTFKAAIKMKCVAMPVCLPSQFVLLTLSKTFS